MKIFRSERVGIVTGTLFFMEVVVLDKGLYPIFLHETGNFLPSRNRNYATPNSGKRV